MNGKIAKLFEHTCLIVQLFPLLPLLSLPDLFSVWPSPRGGMQGLRQSPFAAPSVSFSAAITPRIPLTSTILSAGITVDADNNAYILKSGGYYVYRNDVGLRSVTFPPVIGSDDGYELTPISNIQFVTSSIFAVVVGKQPTNASATQPSNISTSSYYLYFCNVSAVEMIVPLANSTFLPPPGNSTVNYNSSFIIASDPTPGDLASQYTFVSVNSNVYRIQNSIALDSSGEHFRAELLPHFADLDSPVTCMCFSVNASILYVRTQAFLYAFDATATLTTPPLWYIVASPVTSSVAADPLGFTPLDRNAILCPTTAPGSLVYAVPSAQRSITAPGSISLDTSYNPLYLSQTLNQQWTSPLPFGCVSKAAISDDCGLICEIGNRRLGYFDIHTQLPRWTQPIEYHIADLIIDNNNTATIIYRSPKARLLTIEALHLPTNTLLWSQNLLGSIGTLALNNLGCYYIATATSSTSASFADYSLNNIPSGLGTTGASLASAYVTMATTFLHSFCPPPPCPPNSFGNNILQSCTCNAGYNGTVITSSEYPFFINSCTPVHCPPLSRGESVVAGCACVAGAAGSISTSLSPPYYSGSCTPVSCPAYSSGSNVVSGCSCMAGASGGVTASTSSPFYTGSCTPVSCPAYSSGSNVVSGCSCVAGASGGATASMSSPFYTGSCTPVSCPAYSTGSNVVSGCSCVAGASGGVTASTLSPFYTGSCTPVSCPAYSTGSNVVSGCSCVAGASGGVAASMSSPFYTGSCIPASCPAYSVGGNVVLGCSCVAGASGGIYGITSSPFYGGSCTPVLCPVYSVGGNVVSGCSCTAGASGSITATRSSPFYIGSCSPVSCPPYSKGANLVMGCSCVSGTTGSITASTIYPYYTGGCSLCLFCW